MTRLVRKMTASLLALWLVVSMLAIPALACTCDVGEAAKVMDSSMACCADDAPMACCTSTEDGDGMKMAGGASDGLHGQAVMGPTPKQQTDYSAFFPEENACLGKRIVAIPLKPEASHTKLLRLPSSVGSGAHLAHGISGARDPGRPIPPVLALGALQSSYLDLGMMRC
jgi:hypothetical protein